MNRTGLFIALGLFAAIAIVFGVWPELDLTLAKLFYDPETRNFPTSSLPYAQFARDGAMWISWAFVVPSIAALIIKLIWPNRPLLVKGRTMAFLIITIVMSAGVLTNLTFKSLWSRPRPVMVTELGGPWQFKAWWDPTGQCGRNCSFFSGEGATAFWTYAPAALAPPALRPAAYAAATVFGIATSGWRMAFGGHFFTDVSIAGLVSFFVIWLVHGWIYRWPRTRMTDDDIDRWLTKIAWPGYSWRRRMLSGSNPPRPSLGNGITDQHRD